MVIIHLYFAFYHGPFFLPLRLLVVLLPLLCLFSYWLQTISICKRKYWFPHCLFSPMKKEGLWQRSPRRVSEWKHWAMKAVLPQHGQPETSESACTSLQPLQWTGCARFCVGRDSFSPGGRTGIAFVTAYGLFSKITHMFLVGSWTPQNLTCFPK